MEKSSTNRFQADYKCNVGKGCRIKEMNLKTEVQGFVNLRTSEIHLFYNLQLYD